LLGRLPWALSLAQVGENFAREVISHLKNIHTRRYEKKVMNLSQRYGISKDEIMRMVNMDLDLHTNELSHSGPVDTLAPPKAQGSGQLHPLRQRGVQN
jgi:hypothetical protein